MVDRRFIEVHGMFFFPRVVRILEGPIYDSISVYLKTSVIHYQKKISSPEEEQPKLHNSNNSLINCHTFSNVFCRSSFPKFRQLFPFAFYMFVQGPLKQMDGKCLNGLGLWWDWLKSWKWFRFMIKIFEKYFQMANFIDIDASDCCCTIKSFKRKTGLQTDPTLALY